MLKDGVDLRGLSPVWGIAYCIIAQVFQESGYPCVITSANDSRHGVNSLHYKGGALDLRTKHVPEPRKSAIISEIRLRLGRQFDVVYESAGKLNEHLHVEFDPKEPERSSDV